MDDTVLLTDLCGGSTPPQPPTHDVSCKRRRSSSPRSEDACVKKLKRLNDDVVTDQGNTRGANDTVDINLEKPLSRVKVEEQSNPVPQERKVIKMKGALPNLALPDGWIALNHRSGGIIYLHRQTRVCTWSRPYFIGHGSVRKHDVPLAAVPCLHHKKALEKEKENKVSEKSRIDAEFKQGGTLLNFLNAPDPLMPKDSGNGVPGASIDPPGGGVIGVFKLLHEDTKGCVLQDTQQLETPEKSSACSVTNTGEAASTTEGSLPSATEFQNGLDVVISIHNADVAATGSDPNGSRTEWMDRSDVNHGGSSLKESSKRAASAESPHREMISAHSLSSKNGLSSEKAKDGSISKSEEANSQNSNSENGDVACLENGRSSPANGIELVDAKQLEVYLSSLWEFESMTEDQERNALVRQPDIQPETEIELPASLDCLPYSVKGVEVCKQAKEILADSHNKTPVAILHEHCQRTLKIKPVYVILECDSPQTPFMAEVQIDGMKYGSGAGSTKKRARQEAAEATLEALLPGLLKNEKEYVVSQQELEFFDKVNITDRQLYDLCTRVNIPTPSKLLQECLKRNHGVCPSTINFHLTPGQNQDHIYTITCGKHTATGSCRNKKIGKQLASQAILKKLHPHLEKWGSLLRIYCDRRMAVVKKSKKDMTEKPDGDLPHNERLLIKLREEMLKLSKERNNASPCLSESRLPMPQSVFTIEI